MKAAAERSKSSPLVRPIVKDVLRSPGRPLDHTTRAFVEPRFGHDFSHVRVHTDERAADAARSVSALAYTVGKELVQGLDVEAGREGLGHRQGHLLQHPVSVYTRRRE